MRALLAQRREQLAGLDGGLGVGVVREDFAKVVPGQLAVADLDELLGFSQEGRCVGFFLRGRWRQFFGRRGHGRFGFRFNRRLLCRRIRIPEAPWDTNFGVLIRLEGGGWKTEDQIFASSNRLLKHKDIGDFLAWVNGFVPGYATRNLVNPEGDALVVVALVVGERGRLAKKADEIRLPAVVIDLLGLLLLWSRNFTMSNLSADLPLPRKSLRGTKSTLILSTKTSISPKRMLSLGVGRHVGVGLYRISYRANGAMVGILMGILPCGWLRGVHALKKKNPPMQKTGRATKTSTRAAMMPQVRLKPQTNGEGDESSSSRSRPRRFRLLGGMAVRRRMPPSGRTGAPGGGWVEGEGRSGVGRGGYALVGVKVFLKGRLDNAGLARPGARSIDVGDQPGGKSLVDVNAQRLLPFAGAGGCGHLVLLHRLLGLFSHAGDCTDMPRRCNASIPGNVIQVNSLGDL